jgi:hypothetical protein
MMSGGLVISSLALAFVIGCMPGEANDRSSTDGRAAATSAPADTAPAGTSAPADASVPADATPPADSKAPADTGAPADSGAPADASVPEAAPASGNVDWQTCGAVSFKPGISAEDFCAKYMTACGYDAAGARSRYKNAADCMARYLGLSDGPMGGKACVAWYICIAAQDSPDTYCPHAAAASMMSGPCKPSYL